MRGSIPNGVTWRVFAEFEGADGRLLMYVKQKAFRLKEDIRSVEQAAHHPDQRRPFSTGIAPLDALLYAPALLTSQLAFDAKQFDGQLSLPAADAGPHRSVRASMHPSRSLALDHS